MNKKIPKLQMLNLQQLLERWKNKFSLENVLEFGNEAWFGIYVKPKCKRKTYHNIQTTKDYQLSKKWESFKKKHPYFLKQKPNFERLATSEEIEVEGICANGSIQEFMENNKLNFCEWNNTFGFVELNFLDGKPLPDELQNQSIQSLKKSYPDSNFEKHIIAPSYALQATINIARPSFPEGYKGYFSEENLFFCVKQIEVFERNNDLFKSEKISEQNVIARSDSDVAIQNDKISQIIKYHDAGKKICERNTGFSKIGVDEAKKLAEHRYKPYRDKAIELVNEKPRHYSANNLAEIVFQKIIQKPILLSKDTLRKKFIKDDKIKSFLKSHRKEINNKH